MSTLQTLRNKAGILITVVIGLSLVAFILTDLLQSGQSMFSGPVTTVAEVNGTSISIEKYSTLLTNMEENQQRSGQPVDERAKLNLKRSAWDEIIIEELYNQEFQKLGLGIPSKQHGNIIGVTAEELKDMVLGDNISPVMQQYFTNKETGQYDRNSAKSSIQGMSQNEEQKNAWIELEKYIMSDRLRTKYKNLIIKGLYTTTKEAEFIAKSKNKNVNIQIVGENYISIPDSTITVSEKDIEDYLKQNEEKYINKETSIDIEYLTFDILPTERDYEATKKWLIENADDFKLTDNNEQFIRSNSDIPFDFKFYGPGELPARLDSFAYNPNAVVGDITEIYFENDLFKVSKISKIELIPDSVHARHILIKTQNAVAEADSIIKLLEAGKEFAILAAEKSEDGSAQSGGDLGWFKEGAMVKPFNDTCFLGTPGKFYKVFSQFGVHIVEILEQAAKSKKIQIATLGSKVVASTVTRNSVYSKAGKFVNENKTRDAFIAAIDPKVTGDKKIANELKKSDYTIAGLSNSRQIIKWAFNSELNAVSEVFECDNQFVVATISKISEEGEVASGTDNAGVKAEIIKEKKGKILADKINALGAINSLSELSQKLGQQINDAANINFFSMAIPGIGAEPKIIGLSSVLESGKISPVVIGDYGVYVISVTSINENQSSTTEQEKTQTTTSNRSRIEYSIPKALKDKAEIEDNRIVFE